MVLKINIHSDEREIHVYITCRVQFVCSLKMKFSRKTRIFTPEYIFLFIYAMSSIISFLLLPSFSYLFIVIRHHDPHLEETWALRIIFEYNIVVDSLLPFVSSLTIAIMDEVFDEWFEFFGINLPNSIRFYIHSVWM